MVERDVSEGRGSDARLEYAMRKTWAIFLVLLPLAACEPTASMDVSKKGPTMEPAAATTTSKPAEKVVLTDAQWRERLTAVEYQVLRQKGTERAFTGKYDEHFEPGTYVCAGCGAELFESDAKFNSGCGWPAFYAAKAGDKVKLTPDYSHGMVRTEVTCAKCDGHLGHVFDDAPQTPTGQRYCINSVSMKFVPKNK